MLLPDFISTTLMPLGNVRRLRLRRCCKSLGSGKDFPILFWGFLIIVIV